MTPQVLQTTVDMVAALAAGLTAAVFVPLGLPKGFIPLITLLTAIGLSILITPDPLTNLQSVLWTGVVAGMAALGVTHAMIPTVNDARVWTLVRLGLRPRPPVVPPPTAPEKVA